MSTNYYLYRKNTAEARQKIIDFLIKNDYSSALELIDEMNHGIHLGGTSCGWKFAVDYHKGKYFEKSVKSFIDFIHSAIESNDYECVDEYGRAVSSDYIFGQIVSHSTGYSTETYYKEHPENRLDSFDVMEEVVDDMCRFCFYEDFC